MFAWELGSGMGHIGNALNVLAGLRERGHEVVAVVRSLAAGTKYLGPLGIEVRQAPRVTSKKFAAVATYPGVLAQVGWTNLAVVLNMTRQWSKFVDEIRPDQLIVEHAPSALLAARGRHLSIVNLGTGWSVPLAATPMPSVVWWLAPDPDLQAKADATEAQVLRAMNGAAALVGVPPLEAVIDLFSTSEPMLVTWPEFDHYGVRPDVTYYGPQMMLESGFRASWSGSNCSGSNWSGSEKRVVGYLRAESKTGLALIRALALRDDIESVIYLAGADPHLRAELNTPRMTLVDQPLDLASLLPEADVLVTHASFGTVTAGVLHGVRQIGVPRHLEQAVVMSRIEALQIGRNARALTSEQVGEALDDVLSNPQLEASAKALAAKYRGYDAKRAATVMVDRCEALLARR